MKAGEFLQAKGYEILERNYHCRYGEIDLIARSPEEYIVFIEVKARSTKRYGGGAEAITQSKCQKIKKASKHYIYEKHLGWNRNYRYDVIVFQNEHADHIVNAFY